jgi:hypothetical protein
VVLECLGMSTCEILFITQLKLGGYSHLALSESYSPLGNIHKVFISAMFFCGCAFTTFCLASKIDCVRASKVAQTFFFPDKDCSWMQIAQIYENPLYLLLDTSQASDARELPVSESKMWCSLYGNLV